MFADILLCDAASVRDGLLFVLGAGVTRVWRESYPAPLGLQLAMLVTLQPSESHDEHRLRIILQDQDGKPVAKMDGGFGAKAGPDSRPGEALAFPIVVGLEGLPIPSHGVYSIEVLIDHQLARSLVFQAELKQDQPK